MTTISTATPSVTTREHRPAIPDEEGTSIASHVDLNDVWGWSYLASFAVSGLGFTYNSGGPSVDIAQGLVARYEDDGQKLLTVGSVSGVALASSSVNYLFYKADDTYEVRDADEPPSPDALLVGTIDTSNGTVTDDRTVRGRNPLNEFDAGGGGAGGVDVEDDQTTVVTGASAISAGAGMSASDDGDGTATLDVLGIGVRQFAITSVLTTLTSTNFTRDTPIQLGPNSNYLYVGSVGNNQLYVYDVSTPSSPSLVGNVSPTTSPADVAIDDSGDYVYLCDNTSTASPEVIDVTTKSSPSSVFTGSSDFSGLDASGDQLLGVRTQGGLRGFDISSPTSPSNTNNSAADSITGATSVVKDPESDKWYVQVSEIGLSTSNEGHTWPIPVYWPSTTDVPMPSAPERPTAEVHARLEKPIDHDETYLYSTANGDMYVFEGAFEIQSTGAQGNPVTRISKTSGNGQTFNEFDNKILTMQNVDIDQLGTADLSNDRIDIPSAGVYKITASAQMNNLGDDVDYSLSIDRSLAESFAVDISDLTSIGTGADKYTAVNSLITRFDSSDSVYARFFSGSDNSFTVIGREGHRTFLEVEKLTGSLPTSEKLDIEEDDTVVTENASALNAGSGITAADDGDGTATISAEQSYGTKAGQEDGTNQSLGTYADQRLILDGAEFDTMGGFDNANNKIVAQSDGLYQISLMITTEGVSSSTRWTATIWAGGNIATATRWPATVSGSHASVSRVFNLTSGDDIYAEIGTNAEGLTVWGQKWRNFLSVVKIP